MDAGRRPRLCHITKIPDFDGFGFNLHAEKHKTGHYIGRVEEDSPASHAGLLEGDRLLEVNGNSVVNFTHAQVVNSIKSVPDETKLLVVDPLTDQYFEEENIPISGSLRNILCLSSEPPNIVVAEDPALPKSNSVSRTGSIRASIGGLFSKNPPENSQLDPNAKRRSSKKYGDFAYANLIKCPIKTDKNYKGYGFDLHNQPTTPIGSNALPNAISGDTSPLMSPTISSTSSPLPNISHGKVLILEDASKPPEEQTEEPIPFEGAHFVGNVEPGSPAETAGLMTGDIIYKVNNRPVSGVKHDEVVHLIRTDPEKAEIIVARKIGDNWSPPASPTRFLTSSNPGVDKNKPKEDYYQFPTSTTTEIDKNQTTAVKGNIAGDSNNNITTTSPNVTTSYRDRRKPQTSPSSYSSAEVSGGPFPESSQSKGSGNFAKGATIVAAAAGAPIIAKAAFNRKAMMSDNNSSAFNDQSEQEVPVILGTNEPCDKLPIVKLVNLRKWQDFNGYGFNLHAGKIENDIGPDGKPCERIGHFIGNVDDNSPAAAVGMEEGDRIIEVNNKNVENMDHKSVVNLIRSDPESTRLLLVAQKDYAYFQNNHITITPKWDNVVETYSFHPDGKPSRCGSVNKSSKTNEIGISNNDVKNYSGTAPASQFSPFLLGGAPLVAVQNGVKDQPAPGYHDKSDFRAYESNNMATKGMNYTTSDNITNSNNNKPYAASTNSTMSVSSPSATSFVPEQNNKPHTEQPPHEYLNVAAERTPDWERGRGHEESYNRQSHDRYTANRYYPNKSPDLAAMNARDGVNRVPVGSSRDYGAGRIIGSGDHDVNQSSTFKVAETPAQLINTTLNQNRNPPFSSNQDYLPSFSSEANNNNNRNSSHLERQNRFQTNEMNQEKDGQKMLIDSTNGSNKIDSPSKSKVDKISSNSNSIDSTLRTNKNATTTSTFVEYQSSPSAYQIGRDVPSSATSSSSTKDVWNMSASEYKARLDNERRKRDLPKFDTSQTLKDKYELLQQM